MLEMAQCAVTVNGQDTVDAHRRLNPVVAANNDASNWQPLQPHTVGSSPVPESLVAPGCHA